MILCFVFLNLFKLHVTHKVLKQNKTIKVLILGFHLTDICSKILKRKHTHTCIHFYMLIHHECVRFVKMEFTSSNENQMMGQKEKKTTQNNAPFGRN